MLDGVGATVAQALVAVAADLRQDAPATYALVALGLGEDDADLGHIRDRESVRGRRPDLDGDRRGDRDLGQIDAIEGGGVAGRDENSRRRFQRRTDMLGRAFKFERASDHAAHIADGGPTRG